MVINTAELLQHILLHLDMRTALTACMRVCRVWHHILTTNRAIQRALFLLPEPDFPSSTTPASTRQHRRLNPLLAELFPAWFNSSPHERPSTLPADETPLPTPKDSLARHRWQPFHASGIARNRRGFLYRGASWRRMLVAQPPVRRLSNVFRLFPRAADSHHYSRDHAVNWYTAFEAGDNCHEVAQHWQAGRLCTCMAPSLYRHPIGEKWAAMSAEEEAVFFGEEFRDPAMLDGLRMGTLYDKTQHTVREGQLWNMSRWRILWEPPVGEEDANAVTLGQFGEIGGGPVVEVSTKFLNVSQEDWGEIFVQEAEWEVQFRFPEGSGLALVERRVNGDAGGGLGDDEARLAALAAIRESDRKLDEKDEMYARAMKYGRELSGEA